MSIYSGFATRFQEESYDHCIDSLLYILQKRIIKFYQNEQADEETFINLVLKLHQQMKNMEKSKYLDPKSSQAINELVKSMTVFQDNTLIHQRLQAPQTRDKVPKSDLKPVVLPEVPNQNKKKSLYWVQKPAQAEALSNKTSSQQQMQTINKNSYDVTVKEGNIQLRKTTYNHANLRGVRRKNASRANLSKQKTEEKHLAEVRPPKKRSSSNYIQEKHQVQSKMTHYAHSFRGEAENTMYQKRNRLSPKVSAGDIQTLQTPDKQNEVADIIREYIIKAKKGHVRGSKYVYYKDSSSRVNDF